MRVWSDVTGLFSMALEKFAKVDIVCANAGIADREDLAANNLSERVGMSQTLTSKAL